MDSIPHDIQHQNVTLHIKRSLLPVAIAPIFQTQLHIHQWSLSVHTGFLVTALSGPHVLAANIGNAHLPAPVREKIHTTAGPEFGPNHAGKTVIVVWAMYGLKSSGAAWHAQLSQKLHDMGFRPTPADPDILDVTLHQSLCL
jgi:hypothetical protein